MVTQFLVEEVYLLVVTMMYNTYERLLHHNKMHIAKILGNKPYDRWLLLA